MASGDFTVRVLGPVQLVTSDGEVTDLPSASQRRLLAALALHAPRPVRTEWLCDVLDVTPVHCARWSLGSAKQWGRG